jgi:ATP-binding cassette subfamily B protein
MPATLFGMLRHYLRHRRGTVTLLGALLLASTGAQALTPLIVRHVIDSAMTGAALADLVWWGAAYGGAATLAFAITVVATFLSVRIGWQSTNALRVDLLRHTVRLDLRFHHNHSPGEMIERVDGDITLMSNYFAEFVVQIVGNALVIIGVMAVIFSQDWRVGAVMTGFVVVSWSVLLAMRSIGVEQWQRTRQASGELFGFLEETLTGIEDIHTSNGRPYVIRRFYQLTRRYLGYQIKAGMRTNVMVNAWLMVDTMGYAVGLGLGALLYLNGLATLGMAYLVFHYAGMISRPLRMVVFQMEDFQRAAAAARRAVRLLDERSALTRSGPRVNATPAARPVVAERAASGRAAGDATAGERPVLPAGALAVRFDGVTFGYDPALPVLDDISLDLPAGGILGLIGRTGSGKTTLSRLLFRFYDVDRGSVQLGGHDVRALDLAALRARLGMVNQRVDLVHGSVRDNLTLFDTALPDEEIIAVLDDLGLGRWWRALPQGVHTELAGQNAELSAGQAQLLAFGRVFLLSDPAVVVLDEASSRLDPGTERSIEHAVDRLVAGRTAIIIAHRLSTVLRADWIALLDNGRLAEYDRRETLLADPRSRLSRLLRHGSAEVLQ